ncbi:hypothetical protein Pmar_PMAR019371, partial [Perkinsus marinus ATCC 50983]
MIKLSSTNFSLASSISMPLGDLSNAEIRQLFEELCKASVEDGWVSILLHYSVRSERTTTGGTGLPSLLGVFDNAKYTGVNDNQCNGAELNARYKIEDECYLPMATLQLRRTGLDGSPECAASLRDFKVKTPIVDPALCSTVVLTAMITGKPLQKAMEKVLQASSGLCLGQSWLCTPTVWVDREGKQLASTRVKEGDRSSHMHSREHKMAINWTLWYARDLYAIMQATAEGLRVGMSITYSELDASYWNRSWDTNNWVLAEGKLHPKAGYLACVICDKYPSSLLKVSEHMA